MKMTVFALVAGVAVSSGAHALQAEVRADAPVGAGYVRHDSLGTHPPQFEVRDSIGTHPPQFEVRDSIGTHPPQFEVRDSIGTHPPQ
jgi:hypothetical protein